MGKKNRKARRLARKKAREFIPLQDDAQNSVESSNEVTLDQLASGTVVTQGEPVDSGYAPSDSEPRYTSDPLECIGNSLDNIGTAIQGVNDANRQINQGMADLYGVVAQAHSNVYDAQVRANSELCDFMSDTLSGKYDEPKPLPPAVESAMSTVGKVITVAVAAGYIGLVAWAVSATNKQIEECAPFRAKAVLYQALSPEQQVETPKPFMPNKCKPTRYRGGLI